MRIRSVALLSAVAAAALAMTPGDADARGRRRPARRGVVASSLTRPLGAPDADAAGALRIRSGRGGNRLLVRLRGLESRQGYSLRRAGARTDLGRIETNRRGAGSLLLRRVSGLAGAALEVVDADTGETVLEGDAPDAESAHDAVRKADIVMEGAGARASLSLRSDRRSGSERMVLRAVLPADGSYELFMDDGDGVMTSVGALDAGDGEGEHAHSRHPGDHHSDRPVNATAADGSRNGDRDSDADAEDAGDSGHDGSDGDGGDDDADHQDGDHEDGDNEDSDDGDDDSDRDSASEFSFSVDTARGTKLPFDAESLDDLAGRAIEIRNADGTVILSGEVPVLLDSRDDDDGNDGDDDVNDDGNDDGHDGHDGDDGHDGEDGGEDRQDHHDEDNSSADAR